MFPIRVKTVQESDLRMLGSLARNIQRVLPVTQADIDAAAALGKGWVVWKVFEVSDPLDNMRGGTQLIIRQNSVQPGQNVRRVIFVAGPGGQTVVIRGTDYIVLPDAIADSLSYVKAFGGTEQRNLPDGYTQRQFVYMMAGSYVKVEDLLISADYRVEFEFQTLTLPMPLRNFIGGRANGMAAGGGFRLSKLASGGSTLNRVVLYGFENGTEYYDPTAQFQPNTRYKYTYTNGVCTLESGGSVVSTRTFTVTDTTSTKWGINSYVSGNDSWQTDTGEIYVYSVKVWNDQDELVMNLVPAIQQGTVPVVGFYDTVTGDFRTAAAGTLAAGPEVVPTPDAPMDIISNNGVLKVRNKSGLPLGYQRVEYLGSDSQAYIDTGIAGGSDTLTVECKFMYDTFVAYGGIYGNYVSDSHNGIRCIIENNVNRIITNHNTICTTSGNTVLYCARSQIHTIISKHDTAILDDVTTVIQNTATGTENANNIALFNRSITNPNTSRNIGLRVYGFKIYDADVLVSNLIPCRREIDSVLGMYDLVSDTFLTNVGTGAFTAGNPVNDLEIYTDGAVETINVHSANLIDLSAVTDGYYYTPQGVYEEAQPARITDYIPVVAGQKYTVYVKVTGGTSLSLNARINYFDTDKTWLSQDLEVVARNSENAIVITPSVDGYLRVSANATSPTLNVDWTTMQIVKGEYTISTLPPYTDYYNGGTATAEMLLKVGDYQDEQEILSGAVTRKVGVKVFDGSETFTKSSSGGMITQIPDVAVGATNNPINTHFALETSPTSLAVGKQRFGASGTQIYSTNYYMKPLTNMTVAQFQQWLTDQYNAGTPVIVVYPLATPTTESVAGQPLQVTDGDNTLEITQASLIGLELEVEYNAAVSLTIQEVQDANLDNNVTVTIQ